MRRSSGVIGILSNCPDESNEYLFLNISEGIIKAFPGDNTALELQSEEGSSF
jgi:hypothetical protein